jgi:hypothetical protein
VVEKDLVLILVQQLQADLEEVEPLQVQVTLEVIPHLKVIMVVQHQEVAVVEQLLLADHPQLVDQEEQGLHLV